MIDLFRNLARIALPFKMLIGIATIIAFIFIVILITIFTYPSSYEEDMYLIPSILGFLWLLSAYLFIVNFSQVPVEASNPDKFWARIKFKLHRAWYHFLGLVFLGVSGLVVFITSRLISIWLR
ncbi:MAG: hypothetical protein KAH84_05295 [Thiomargarita sp.]|nr:hypothetical protein [Thiomargarita sp.]